MYKIPSMRPELAEAAYQLLIYRGHSEGVLLRDFELRYGARFGVLFEEARSLVSKLDDRGRASLKGEILRMAGSIVEVVRSRGCSGLERALKVLELAGLGGFEAVVKAQLELASLDGGIFVELLRCGFLMHDSEDTVVVPEYLIGAVTSIEAELPKPQVDDLIDSIQDELTLAVVEAAIFKSKPHPDAFRALYGVEFADALKTLNVPGLVRYVDGEVVLNPLLDPLELRGCIHRVKDFGARQLRARLSPHGQYTYSRRLRCGVVYTIFGGAGPMLIMLMPWILPTRTLLGYHAGEARVFVVKGRFREGSIDLVELGIVPERTGFVFISGSEAHVVRPRRMTRQFDEFLSLLYRAGLNVLYES